MNGYRLDCDDKIDNLWRNSFELFVDERAKVRHVSIHLGEEQRYIDVLPNEARALAALLIAAAEASERLKP